MSKNHSRINLMANFCNKACSGLILLVCVPFYLKYLGIEAYGITGFYLLLSFLLVPIEAAIGTTINRQMAQLTAVENTRAEAADLFRSLEGVYWFICLLTGLSISCLSNSIAYNWVHPVHLSLTEVAQAVILMGICLSFQWPNSLYFSALMGLQKQVLVNSVQVFFTFLKSAGVIAVLAFIEPSLRAFFIWQLIIVILHTLTFAILLWKYMPQDRGFFRAHFCGKLLKQSWPFISQTFFLTLTSTCIVSLDKLFVSRYASLEVYGYYILAYNLSNGLYLMIQPFFYSLFPRFSQLIAQKKLVDLCKLYENYSQVVAVLVLPLAILCVCFTKELIFIWVRDPQIAEKVAPILRLFILGTACNGLMSLPLALQYSFGWLKAITWQNIITLTLLFPVMFLLYEKLGVLAVASIWFIHNLCSLLILPIIHRKLMPKSNKNHWIKKICILPLIAPLALNILAMNFLPKIESLYFLVTVLSCLGIGSIIFSFCLTSIFRDWIKTRSSPKILIE
jgi:O-antigen/teichoic acid export membrane protein